MPLVTEFKCRFEGIEGFCHGLEELTLEHLRECRSSSPDLCVMRLVDEIGIIEPKHTGQFQAVEEDPALGALHTFITVIDYEGISKDVAASAEKLWSECALDHVVS